MMSRGQSVGKESKKPCPTSDEVRAYLRTLLERNEFDASERHRRFLAYVVEQTLEGRTDHVKAYNIALAVFDRGADFNPVADPIVRIEAGRLRRSLEHYYLTAGKADPVRIDIPKGSYIATFTHGDGRAEQEKTSTVNDTVMSPNTVNRANLRSRWFVPAVAGLVLLFAIAIAGAYILIERGQRTILEAVDSGSPSILVLPFEDAGGNPSQSFIARGLTYDIIGHLTQFEDIAVFGWETSFQVANSAETDLDRVSVRPNFTLSGSVQSNGTKLKVSAILADGATGQYIWSSAIGRDLTTASLIDVQSEIADQVAAAIAQPYGMIFQRSAQEISSRPAESLVAYQCVVRFREYWRSYSEQDFDGVRTCLENTIANDPAHAQGHASLALLYVNAYRMGLKSPRLPPDLLRSAADLAERAIALDPNLADGYLAQSLTLWYLHDTERSIQAAERGLARRPNNTVLMAELGLRYALRADWDDAMPLIEKAYERNPGSSSGYHFATFLHAYMTGDYVGALTAASKVQTPGLVYGALARAATYGQLGDRANARREIAEVLKIDANYADRLADDLAGRNFDPAIVLALTDGLAKAGLSPALIDPD